MFVHLGFFAVIILFLHRCLEDLAFDQNHQFSPVLKLTIWNLGASLLIYFNWNEYMIWYDYLHVQVYLVRRSCLPTSDLVLMLICQIERNGRSSWLSYRSYLTGYVYTGLVTVCHISVILFSAWTGMSLSLYTVQTLHTPLIFNTLHTPLLFNTLHTPLIFNTFIHSLNTSVAKYTFDEMKPSNKSA